MPWAPFAERLPSPNHSARTGSVLGALQHSTVGAWAPSLAELTREDSSPVSAHFLIGLDGRIAQLVDTSRAAWHAMSANGRRIGIEHVDDGDHADPIRTSEQYAASARVNRWCAETHGYVPDETTIEPHRVYVNTACPSGLDVERIIIETQGGDMADYIERAEFEAYVGDVRASFDAVKKALHEHRHGPATFTLALPRKARRVSTKKPTRAEVRAGHGRS